MGSAASVQPTPGDAPAVEGEGAPEQSGEAGAAGQGGMTVEEITAALAAILKKEDSAKLTAAVQGLKDESRQRLEDVMYPKAAGEADLQYAKDVGLQDALRGFRRCAMKMKPQELNKFGADYFLGELEKQKRLVLISSNTDDVDKFKSCVRETGDMGAPIVTSVWDFAATPEAFLAQIKDLEKDHGPFKTVALCSHGHQGEVKEDSEGFKWKLLENCGVQIGTGGESDAGADDILQALADCVTVRLDLLSCDLAASKVGLEWIKEWETKIGKNVAASTDITGNPESGGDWILETDGIDVAGVYFKTQAINEYTGTFSRCRYGW